MEAKKWFFHLVSFSLLIQATAALGQDVTDLKDVQEQGYVSTKQNYKIYYPKTQETSVKTTTTTKTTHQVSHVPPEGITMYTGSLHANVERIARLYGWQEVVWDVPNDYEWVGNAYVSGHNATVVLQKVLKDYPLQAVFYQGNRVLLIQPRTLR